MPVPCRSRQIGVVKAAGVTAQTAVELHMGCKRRGAEAQLTGNLAVGTLHTAMLYIGIDKEKGGTPAVWGEVLNGSAHHDGRNLGI